MITEIHYGLGGYCQDCSPDHDHPLHNVVEIVEIPDPQETTPDTPA